EGGLEEPVVERQRVLREARVHARHLCPDQVAENAWREYRARLARRLDGVAQLRDAYLRHVVRRARPIDDGRAREPADVHTIPCRSSWRRRSASASATSSLICSRVRGSAITTDASGAAGAVAPLPCETTSICVLTRSIRNITPPRYGPASA